MIGGGVVLRINPVFGVPRSLLWVEGEMLSWNSISTFLGCGRALFQIFRWSSSGRSPELIGKGEAQGAFSQGSRFDALDIA